MTQAEFKKLPFLLFEQQVMEVTGYARPTVAKLLDCQVLKPIQPRGCHRLKVQLVQVAKLIGLEEWVEAEALRFKAEPMLMAEKAVTLWTGYADDTLSKIVSAGGLHLVKPPGLTNCRYRKREIAQLVGLERWM